MTLVLPDRDTLRRYDVAGPRYTSYPSAAHFGDTVDEAAVRERLDALRADPAATARDLSLYVHLPFCQSLCWYCGCTTVITRDRSQGAAYLARLARELEVVGALAGAGPEARRRVGQVHLGGGTPTFLAADELRELGRLLWTYFAPAADVEAGVEIDPRRLTLAQVEALAEAGFNRASIGVQDHDPVVQRAVNRIQTPAETARAVAWLRGAGFASVNVDLIYGLPHQSPATFARTLDDVLALAPDRLAVFGYAHVPWMRPAQRLLERAALPDAEARVDLLACAIERLTAAGYVHVGLDHFARPEDELAVAQRAGTLQRNFQGYSTRGGADLLAFGMSAISFAGGLYWQNHKALDAYAAALDAGRLPVARGYALTADDHVRGRVIMRLMCDLRLDWPALSAELGLDVADYLAAEIASLDDLEADGLVARGPAGLAVTDAGRLLVRNVAMRFDPHVRAGPATPRYSRTV
ncbi:MAG TPA: oxygen-independent coproporphyrinogen III oxidase [Gemmatimonadales bacterium]|nr:oxygen-independent coproporphyrinogen III oxidase [Gemmatimonadales bacterium]